MSKKKTINENELLPVKSQFMLYQTEDGRTRIEVRLQDETVWLTQKLMAELSQKDRRTINEHIQNIFEEGELIPESAIRKFRITAADGQTEHRRQMLQVPSQVERHFINVVQEMKKLEKSKPQVKKKTRKGGEE
jgi:hypothetical protein